MKTLAIIPARGGSKGIPGKNLVPLCGKPLLQYTIDAAKASALIDEIFLSSDDEKIISYGLSQGLRGDYRRPAEISGDSAQVIDAVIDALDWLEMKGLRFDTIILLQPTSPLRTYEDIDGALRMFSQSNTNSLVSVHTMTEHPYECIKKTDNGWRWLEKPSHSAGGRQDYDQCFLFVNGAIYVASINYLRTHRALFREGEACLFTMPSWRGLDIDEPHQLRLAEQIVYGNQ